MSVLGQQQRTCCPSAVPPHHSTVIKCCCLLLAVVHCHTVQPALQLVPAPCDPSKAADISFDASASRDGSGRRLVKYRWVAPGSNDVVLNAAVSVANAAEGGAGTVRWVQLPVLRLDSEAQLGRSCSRLCWMSSTLILQACCCPFHAG